MSSKKPAFAAGGAAAAVLTAAGLSLTPATAVAQDQPTFEAYASYVEGSVVNSGKTPEATRANQDPGSKLSLVLPPNAPEGERNLDLGVLNANVDTANGTARSSVADLTASLAPGNETLTIKATLVEGVCEQGDVSSRIAGLTINGQDINVDTEPGTNVVPEPLSDVLRVTVNEQEDHADGSSSVTALSVGLLEATDITGHAINLGHARCGPAENGGSDGGADDGSDGGADDGGADDGGADDGGADGGADDGGADAGDDSGADSGADAGDDSGDNGDGGTAPRPTPVEGHHPVTG